MSLTVLANTSLISSSATFPENRFNHNTSLTLGAARDQYASVSSNVCCSACLCHRSVFYSCVSFSPPRLRSVPLGEQLSLRWPLGAESLAARGAGAVQPGHGRFPPPQAKRSIHHMAHRARQTSRGLLLHRHAAAHHRVRGLAFTPSKTNPMFYHVY